MDDILFSWTAEDSGFHVFSVVAGQINPTAIIGGGEGDDTVAGSDGNDSVSGGGGDDSIAGGGGTDTLFGGAGNDQVYGNVGDDILYGNTDADSLYGGQGNDVVRGNNGDDQLFGNRGDDVLDGGSGNDTYTGGAGSDVFQFTTGEAGAAEVIEDFASGEDTVAILANINGSGIASAADILARTADNDSGAAVIDLGGGQTITLVGTSTASLSASDFDIL